jgi:hypothetical protein
VGDITSAPTFLPNQLPIPFGAGNVGEALVVKSATTLGWGPGGGGGVPGRYTATLSGATSELAPSGFPGTDTGSRIIVTCTANSLVQTLTAGNDGQLVFIWNATTAAAGFNIELENDGTGAGAVFLVPGGSGAYAVIPPQSGQMFVYDATLAAYLIAY